MENNKRKLASPPADDNDDSSPVPSKKSKPDTLKKTLLSDRTIYNENEKVFFAVKDCHLRELPPFEIPSDPASPHRMTRELNIEKIARLLGERMAKGATKADMDCALNKMSQNAVSIKEVGLELRSVQETVWETTERIGVVESRIASKDHLPRRNDDVTMTRNFFEFVRSALQIGRDNLADEDVENVIRVRNNLGNHVYAEALVMFHRATDRDLIASKWRNLAYFIDNDGKPTAGLKMDIPPHLMPTFRLLQSSTRMIRRGHGSECRVYIKYDDGCCDLYLDAKLARDSHWMKITWDQAKEMNKDKESEEFNALKRTVRQAGLMNPNMIPFGPAPLALCPPCLARLERLTRGRPPQGRILTPLLPPAAHL